MDAEAEAEPSAAVLKQREAVRKSKEKAKLKDPVGYKRKKAEQTSNGRLMKRMRAAAAATLGAATAAPEAVNALPSPPLPLPPPPPPHHPSLCLTLPYGLVPPPLLPPPKPLSIPPPTPPPLSMQLLCPDHNMVAASPPPPPALPPQQSLPSTGTLLPLVKKAQELERRNQELEDAVEARDILLREFEKYIGDAERRINDARKDRCLLAKMATLTKKPFEFAPVHDEESTECKCSHCEALAFFKWPLQVRDRYLERVGALTEVLNSS